MQEKNKKNTDISERIYQVIEHLSITPNKFTKTLGYKRAQTIYDILNCKSAPSYDFFNRLFNSEYSAMINPIWLLTGKGALTDNISSNQDRSSILPNCQSCIEKERTIKALEKNVELLEKLNRSLELHIKQGSGIADPQKATYQQTATG